jgi:hypothetical protein
MFAFWDILNPKNPLKFWLERHLANWCSSLVVTLRMPIYSIQAQEIGLLLSFQNQIKYGNGPPGIVQSIAGIGEI